MKINSLFTRSLLAALVFVPFYQAHAEVAFPNAGPYTQDYATVWFTEDVSANTKLFQYAVINLGSAATQYQSIELPGNPPTIHEDFRTDTPYIKTYEVPILTAYAYNSIKQETIQSPWGWSYRFIDVATNPEAWTNASATPGFDNPYKVLQWYVDDSQAQDGDLVSHMESVGIHSNDWMTRADLTAALAAVGDESSNAQYGGTECGLNLWHEACVGKGFSFEAEAGKVLGPDQTAWSLVTRMWGQDTVMWPAPPRIGDPDLPVGSNGVSFGGGIALVAPTPAVPEPETYAMFAIGLGLMGFAARRKS